MSTNLTFTETINASPEVIYFNFTNSTAIRGWLSNNGEVDARPGGRVYLHWNQGYHAIGEFTELEKNQSLAFSWHGKSEPAVTQVQVKLTEVEDGTEIELTHSGLGPGEEWDTVRTQLQRGWEVGLTNLKSVLETGLDKRIFDQPFLGIFIAGLIDEKQAKKLGLPVNTGVQITGALPGTGAAAAGLQADDVIHKLAGVELDAFPAFQVALGPHTAGDTVPVVLYRGAEEIMVDMELSRRPLPQVPETPAELAEAVRQAYADLDKRLDEILEGVSEEEANTAPAEGEWSVLQVLAHLVMSERAIQIDTACRINQQSLTVFPGNKEELLNALVASHPSLAQMVALWKTAEAETVNLIEHLPEEFVARKADYLNLGQTFLQGFPNHTQGHYDQIEAAITSVRGKAD